MSTDDKIKIIQMLIDSIDEKERGKAMSLVLSRSFGFLEAGQMVESLNTKEPERIEVLGIEARDIHKSDTWRLALNHVADLSKNSLFVAKDELQGLAARTQLYNLLELDKFLIELINRAHRQKILKPPAEKKGRQ